MIAPAAAPSSVPAAALAAALFAAFCAATVPPIAAYAYCWQRHLVRLELLEVLLRTRQHHDVGTGGHGRAAGDEDRRQRDRNRGGDVLGSCQVYPAGRCGVTGIHARLQICTYGK